MTERASTDALPANSASASLPWWQRRMCCFDLETTSPLPEEARIVSAAVAFVGGGEATETRTWLADPGVEIPEEAAAIHGVTTERARADGAPAREVVMDVLAALGAAQLAGMALVVFNARYDLTVMDREARRHGVTPMGLLRCCVDPAVMDKVLDRFRKSYPQGEFEGAISTRTLGGMCGVYGATLEGAHDAAFDAVAAGRLAYRMGQRGTIRRRARGPVELAESERHRVQWEAGRVELAALHDAQLEWATLERARFAEYKRSIGEVGEAERIELERGWPVLELMPHEAFAV